MKKNESNEGSFNSWLLDKHNLLEKTAGAVILVIEILGLLGHIFHKTPEIPLTQILNLVFLVFVYIQLNKEFSKRYALDTQDPKRIARILRLWRFSEEHKQEKINQLVRDSNKLIGQLRNINYFILATATLYLLFIVKFFVEGERDRFHIFHLVFDLVSYIGAFFLLRCFFVMYLPTIENGRDILARKTNPYIWVGVGLMVLDVCLTVFVKEHSPLTVIAPAATSEFATGVFIAEFVCGVVNAIVFVLLIARFENKILDIPPYILVMLYAYSVLQTCLPFVTNNGLVFGEEFSEAFSSIVFKLVLIGKVAFAAVLFYVLNSGRIVYYFMALKNIHDEEEEEKHWEQFKELITEMPHASEPFEIVYEQPPGSGHFTARIVPEKVFGRLSGSGLTAADAKRDLIKKIGAGR